MVSSESLRPAHMVMDLERLGALFPYRLSFMRILIRKMMKERWRINRARFEQDDQGFGTAVYELTTKDDQYSVVMFPQYLDPNKRSDRVIADEWDLTMVLCHGTVDEKRMKTLRNNVPLQEQGRADASCLVLSRANKSSRMFEYVVGCLANGKQPTWNALTQVGYLYRTTAVYGSGKFGLADWQKVRRLHPDFASPFCAEMFTCFMIRQFSLDQAEHVARHRAPDTAVPLADEVKRFIGIGNATGLGMAPYLLNHPLVISRWIEIREKARALALDESDVDDKTIKRFRGMIDKALTHLSQCYSEDEEQSDKTTTIIQDLQRVRDGLKTANITPSLWKTLLGLSYQSMSVGTQELLVTLLIELFPNNTDQLEKELCVDEVYPLNAQMQTTHLIELIEQHYSWALDLNFEDANANRTFWYRSIEKQEPRLGDRTMDAGSEQEMFMGIGQAVRRCYDDLVLSQRNEQSDSISQFIAMFPQHRQIIRRVQVLCEQTYGDIQANLLDVEVKPMHLLRCKLSLFGVNKFDPRSRLWVRNTMFQGAPVVDDIGASFADDWYFPIAPAEAVGREH